ncbi:hexokinase-3-like, partial [Alligator sinensis]|uniref:Phosphotransferase n=1 Tax=Alligator sinensis TaxID=38654 RepID=A0A1U8DLG6_ALLSI
MSSRQDEPVPQEPHKEAGSPACPAQWVGDAGTTQHPQSQSRCVTEVVQRVLQPLSLSLQQLSSVQHRMLAAMEAGLSLRKGAHAVPMLPTYVRSTPDGTERGSFLVLELRERDLRVLRAELGGGGHQGAQLKDQIFAVPRDLTEGKGEKLFDFMAESLCQFLDNLHIPATSHQLGFFFPFPCLKTGLEKSVLQTWSKGYSCSDVVGRDVGQLLQEAIQKQARHDINVVVVVNDTVATMMGCSLGKKPCEVGLIVGAGTNSCFMAEAWCVESLDDNEGRMCVNTEWGTFGDTGVLADILTMYDEQVDAGSMHKGKHRFEKMIGSLYLGEIARLLLVQLAQDKALHAGGTTPQLLTQDKVTALEVLSISEDQGGLAAGRCLLQKLGLQPSDPDCFTVRQVCLAVVTRAACLCATSLAAILTHMRKNRELPQLDVCVGVDGDIFQGRKFFQTLEETTKKLAPECAATLVLAEEGSCAWGVAVVTAVAVRLRSQRREVDQLLKPLRLAPDARRQVQALLQREMERGLRHETHAQASTRMLPTY